MVQSQIQALEAPLSSGAIVAAACQIPMLSHAGAMTPSEAFVDDSINRQDARRPPPVSPCNEPRMASVCSSRRATETPAQV